MRDFNDTGKTRKNINTQYKGFTVRYKITKYCLHNTCYQ
jgi:hypothetical protein